MKLSTVLSLSLLSALCADGIAQAPGAHWSLITGVSGPSQRRENPGAASSTKFFVFGGKSGNSGGAWMNDLWEYEPIAKSWKELTANGAAGSPLKRDQAGVCFDPGRQKLIVFGGNTWNGVKNDTWEFDFKTGTWKDITPATGNPPARRFHSIAFDPNSGNIILFGGWDANKVHLNDTWMLIAGSSWIKLSTTGVPSTRRQHHLVTRPDFRDILLVAGQNSTMTAPAKWRTDVWRFTGLDWKQIKTTTSPAAVVGNSAAYDSVRQRLVMPGGNGINGGSPTGELSEFDSVSNEWVIRFGKLTPDPVLGRVSRFFMGFVPSTGKMYKISGQVPSVGSSPLNTLEYQSANVATAKIGSPGCAGTAGTPVLKATGLIWQGRDLVLEVDNTPAGATVMMGLGFTTTNIPLSLLGIGAASCVLTVDPLFVFPAINGGSGTSTLIIPVPNSPAVLAAPPMLTQALVVTGSIAVISNRLDLKGGAL
jgi:hypothetical protein